MTELINDDFMAFVSEFKKVYVDTISLLDDGSVVHPDDLNYALAHYYDFGSRMNEEYQRVKRHAMTVDIDYQIWYAEKFDQARNEVIALYSAGETSIKPAVKEYELHLKKKYASEYKQMYIKKEEAEAAVRFVLRQQDLFKKFDDMLTQLSNNMRSEMRSLSIEKRASANGDNRIKKDVYRPGVNVRRRVKPS